MTAPVRPCIGCGQYDDHPRHVTATADGASIPYHMDCCAIARDCEVCQAQIAGADGAKGDELREHLLTTGPAADQPGWTASADDQSDKED